MSVIWDTQSAGVNNVQTEFICSISFRMFTLSVSAHGVLHNVWNGSQLAGGGQ